MTNSELKYRARAALGGSVFGEKWLYAVLTCFIFSAIESVIGGASVGIALLAVTGPLAMGLDYVFLKQSRVGRKIEIEDLFYGFKHDFLGCFLLSLLKALFVCLWSILFIVPGIVKAYGWSMIWYVKFDEPGLETKAILDRSAALMEGHKWELFMLDLSFIGWYILGALCFGIGVFFVMPYHSAARAEFYRSLSE